MSNPVVARYFRWLEFAPLLVFLLLLRWLKPDDYTIWLQIYLIASGISLFKWFIGWYTGSKLHRLALAIDCYFLSSTLALLLRFESVMELYGWMEDLAMLLWMLTICLVLSVKTESFKLTEALQIAAFSDHGKDIIQTRWLSSVILLVTVIAFVIKDLHFYHPFLPFTVIFVFYFRLFTSKGVTS